MAEAILAGKQIKELALIHGSAGLAVAYAIIASFAENFFVRDGPRNRGHRDGQNHQGQKLLPQAHATLTGLRKIIIGDRWCTIYLVVPAATSSGTISIPRKTSACRIVCASVSASLSLPSICSRVAALMGSPANFHSPIIIFTFGICALIFLYNSLA